MRPLANHRSLKSPSRSNAPCRSTIATWPLSAASNCVTVIDRVSIMDSTIAAPWRSSLDHPEAHPNTSAPAHRPAGRRRRHDATPGLALRFIDDHDDRETWSICRHETDERTYGQCRGVGPGTWIDFLGRPGLPATRNPGMAAFVPVPLVTTPSMMVVERACRRWGHHRA